MIQQALLRVRAGVASGTGLNVALTHLHDDVGAAPTAGNPPDPQLWMSLVNLTEEPTLRNQAPYRRPDPSDPRNLRRREPPLFLNLAVLFAARNPDYGSCLIAVSQLVSYCRANPTLLLDDRGTPQPPASADSTLTDAERTDRVTLELVPLSFEQINHLWGVNGGKYYPSVVYRVRVVVLDPQVSAPLAVVLERGEERGPELRLTPVNGTHN